MRLRKPTKTCRMHPYKALLWQRMLASMLLRYLQHVDKHSSCSLGVHTSSAQAVPNTVLVPLVGGWYQTLCWYQTPTDHESGIPANCTIYEWRQSSAYAINIPCIHVHLCKRSLKWVPVPYGRCLHNCPNSHCMSLHG